MNIHKLFTLLRSPRPLEAPASESSKAFTVSSGVFVQLELSRGEVDQAVHLHLEWCALLKRQLAADPNVGPLPAALPEAEQSGLGQWIASHSQGELAQHPQMVELALENRRIHRLAHEAIDFARNQRLDLASSLLNLQFERSRSRMLQLLHLLQKT